MKPLNEQINARFVIQAKKLTQFNRLLQEILPAECRSHVRVANIRQQSLMLITDSPVWTTRLRQLSPQILSFIREHIPDSQTIHHVQISTRYAASQPATGKTSRQTSQQAQVAGNHRRAISKKTARLLSQSADDIKHQTLKNALLKLARHAESSKKTEK